MLKRLFAKENGEKYLSIAESGIKLKAVSRMEPLDFGSLVSNWKAIILKIDSYVDERSDPKIDSRSCKIHVYVFYFGDWELVLASYIQGLEMCLKQSGRSGGKQLLDIRKHLP
jgi:hypothetical protein